MKSRIMSFVFAFFFLTVCCSYVAPEVLEDRKARKHLDEFGEAWAKQHQMYYLGNCTGGLVDSTDCGWSVNFIDNHNTNLADAKVKAKALAEILWKRVASDPSFITVQKMHASHYSWASPNLSIERIGFKIAFWDENVERPLPPYIAQIQFRHGKLLYFYADPATQALKEPIVEEVNFP